MSTLSDEQALRGKAAEIIDALLIVSELYTEDYNCVRDALAFIAETRRDNPAHPITVSLARYMRERGYLQQDE